MRTATGTTGEANHHRPGKTRLPAAERRETILRAATHEFAVAGYRATRVSDVAARIGVSEPVIFQNFGSKAGLFAAVLERAAAEIRASLDDLAAEFGSASGLLGHILAAGTHLEAAKAAGHRHERRAGAGHHSAAYGVLFADAAALTAEPDLTEPVRIALRAVAAHLVDLIRRAQTDGGVRHDVDPEAAAWLLLSVLSARRLRSVAVSPHLEHSVASLALESLLG